MSSTIKVSQLPPAVTPLVGDEEVMVVQSGESRRAPASAFQTVVPVLGGGVVVVAAAGQSNDVVVDVTIVSRVLVTTTAGDATFTGITAGSDGQLMVVTNQGSNLLTLADQNVGSSSANQFYGVTDITLPAKGSQLLSYSGNLSKWVMV
jgi:hypothetical protein